MPETKAKQSAKAPEVTPPEQEDSRQEEVAEITLDKMPLSTLLGMWVADTVRDRPTFPANKQKFREWYDLVKAKQADKREFARLVMSCCDTMRLAAEGFYSQAMEITAGDR